MLRGIVDRPLRYQNPADDRRSADTFEPLRPNFFFRADPMDSVIYSRADLEYALGCAAAVVEQDHNVGLAGEIGRPFSAENRNRCTWDQVTFWQRPRSLLTLQAQVLRAGNTLMNHFACK
jgi:hypothetical protein